ncbi:hypothetical protein [Arthrobacter sp. MDT1-65]
MTDTRAAELKYRYVELVERCDQQAANLAESQSEMNRAARELTTYLTSLKIGDA